MAKTTRRLTAIKTQSLKVPGVYPDGAGLYLRVKDTGAKSWVFRYMLNGRPRYLGLGPASSVTLAKARELANLTASRVRGRIETILNAAKTLGAR